MNPWNKPSGLDRLETERTPERVVALWEGASVLEVDDSGRFAGEGGAPVAMSEPGALRESDVLLGNHLGRVWFARPTPVTVGGPRRGVPATPTTGN